MSDVRCLACGARYQRGLERLHIVAEHGVGQAFERAGVDVERAGADRQAALVRLIEQVADIEQRTADPAGAKYLIVTGVHGAGFRVAICVATDGAVGWALV